VYSRPPAGVSRCGVMRRLPRRELGDRPGGGQARRPPPTEHRTPPPDPAPAGSRRACPWPVLDAAAPSEP